MYRSFTDRLFGGVCGGLATALPLNAWALRGLFVVLTVLTLGAFAVVYLALWLAVPQESLMTRGGGSIWLLLALVLAAASLAGFYTRTTFDLYWPLTALVVGGIFFVKQVLP